MRTVPHSDSVILDTTVFITSNITFNIKHAVVLLPMFSGLFSTIITLAPVQKGCKKNSQVA